MLHLHYAMVHTAELWMPNNPFNLDNTSWSALVKKEAIFEALISNGEQHFSQAMSTPFASGPIVNLIGPLKFNKYSQQILKGEFNIDSITDNIELRDTVKPMAHLGPTNPIESDTELTIDKLCEGFSYVKEGTASNPDGLHHGHWKTLIKDDNTFKLYALMIMFAFKFSEPPNAWTSAHQVMLGKDNPGQPIKINHIHHVQLVCAALNMGFHIIWGHKMMKRATKHGLLSPYQFGTRNGHMAISCILLKHTSYDKIHLMCPNMCIFDNDVTACYDQMIPLQCMIVAARSGVREEEIKTKLTVLSQMKSFVKTAFGISSRHFMNGYFHKVFGLLQGSADAGAIRSINWSVLFNVLDKHFHKARFPPP